MKVCQPISIDYQSIRDDDYIEDSMTRQSMEFNDDCWDESRFWNYIFSQVEFDKFNKKYKATADKKRREKLFEEKRYDDGIFEERENPNLRVPTKQAISW